MDIATPIALLTALGGLEGLKWFFNRKKNNVDWLENRIIERDKKIDALYIELRREQAEHLNTIHKLHEAELRLKEADMRRCDVRKCEGRQPPGEY